MWRYLSSVRDIAKVKLTQKPKVFSFLSFRAEHWPTCLKNVFDLMREEKAREQFEHANA